MSKVENGNTVSVHYRGTLNDGTEFDSSYNRGNPISFQVGAGQMIKGFDNATVGMTVGEKKSITLTPDLAYGAVNPDAVQVVPRQSFAPDFEFIVGNVVHGETSSGQPMVATITEVKDSEVVIDTNHPMAGKDLNFDIELVSIGD